jgi:protocatechuate 3,4-dioxygenase beta subunit
MLTGRILWVLIGIVFFALTGCTGSTVTTESGSLPDAAEPTMAAVEPNVVEPAQAAAEPDEASEPASQLTLDLTPSQTEGPYYPVAKGSDFDNDLTQINGQDGAAQGETLLLSGRVLDETGQGVAGATVEIWQTDASGIYLHPDDPNVASRDDNFQGYGEAVSGADGTFIFKTIYPGEYEPRPRHIHVKVRWNGNEVLTTQFYFAGETSLAGIPESLSPEVIVVPDPAGATLRQAMQDIVVSRASLP